MSGSEQERRGHEITFPFSATAERYLPLITGIGRNLLDECEQVWQGVSNSEHDEGEPVSATPDADDVTELRPLLSIREVAVKLRFSERQVRQWLDNGDLDIPVQKFGKRKRVLLSDLERYIAGRPDEVAG